MYAVSINLANFKSGLDRGAPLWKEAGWLVCRILFFTNPIPLPSRLRVIVLRLFGAKIGRAVVIRGGVQVTFPWRLTVGDATWIGEGVRILNLAEVRIGSNCCVSQNAFLCTGSHRFDRPGFDLVTKPIVVLDSSWVAAQVFIAPGVTIGPDGRCIAGSVVLNDVGAGQTVIGNPAVVKLTNRKH
jgi:putative colanic acid biosynthesis acetyltransferase WcaF